MSNSVTVDLITHDPKHDEYVLYLLEEGPWPDSGAAWHNRLLAIQNRILSAIEAATSGVVASKFPSSVGHKIRIQIDTPSGSPPQLDELVDAVRAYAEGDHALTRSIRGSEFIAGLRIVSGKEVGRYGDA